MTRYGTVDREYGKRLAFCEPSDDGGIYMVNLMKYRDEADYGATGATGEAGVTGREADDRYAPVDVLTEIGAVVCFTGEVLEASEDWDRVGIVRYPTRRAFIEMQQRADFQEKHVHKDAGMDHTIVMGTLPDGDVPPRTKPARMLLEVWQDTVPPATSGLSWTFSVEGTIVGDGRPWRGARFTSIDGDADVDITQASATHQMLVLQPVIERWT